jgi:uncharacterized protein YndB with AHSA1/START domain
VESVERTRAGDEVVGPHRFHRASCANGFSRRRHLARLHANPDGHDMYNTWTYKKIVPKQQIEFVLDWADKDGKRVDPSSMGLPADMPRDVRHVITFKALADNKTEMTVTEFGYTSDRHYELSRAGLNQCLDKMVAALVQP